MRLRRDLVPVTSGMSEEEAARWLRSVGLRMMTTSDKPSVIAEYARLSRRIAKVPGDPVERVAGVRLLLAGEGFRGESIIRFADRT